MIAPERWQNQQEALEFTLRHPAVMLDMDMGTGKTRTALDAVFARDDCRTVLVVCPKAVIPVWRTNLGKFYPDGNWLICDPQKGSIAKKTDEVRQFISTAHTYPGRLFVVVNYDIVWRSSMGEYLRKVPLDCIILDESHRAKSAGSKVSKYLAMIGKRAKYRMCLSGTPMANSPLDVYGQYRFLDPSIFGTNHNRFLQTFAVLGGPDNKFIVGYKNQNTLNYKFQSIAYTCKMSDISDRLKLPPNLPPEVVPVKLPSKDIKLMKELNKEFVAECSQGVVSASNVLVKMLRLQQICSGFATAQNGPLEDTTMVGLNHAKEDALGDMLEDLDIEHDPIVVFCVFKWDIDAVKSVAQRSGVPGYELSGRINQLSEWQTNGGILAVQIQAGAEGIDMTMANHAIYYSLPHSLALYNQSKARLYRPGQTRPVHFAHLIASGTVDESIYKSLQNKQDVIDSIKSGTFDYGFIK